MPGICLRTWGLICQVWFHLLVRRVQYVFLWCSLSSAGGRGEVERHALVSAGSKRPARHQLELSAHADCSRRSQPVWVCVQSNKIYQISNGTTTSPICPRVGTVHADSNPFVRLSICCEWCHATGSISSCDAFLNVFQARGLRPEVICPCASSSEAMTVAIRRSDDVTAAFWFCYAFGYVTDPLAISKNAAFWGRLKHAI